MFKKYFRIGIRNIRSQTFFTYGYTKVVSVVKGFLCQPRGTNYKNYLIISGSEGTKMRIK